MYILPANNKMLPSLPDHRLDVQEPTPPYRGYPELPGHDPVHHHDLKAGDGAGGSLFSMDEERMLEGRILLLPSKLIFLLKNGQFTLLVPFPNYWKHKLSARKR